MRRSFLRWMAVIVLLDIIAFLIAFSCSSHSHADVVTPIPVAHRGTIPGHGVENTAAAYEASGQAGVKILEVDVRFSSSNYAVMMHDATVDRTTNGTGAVSSRTLTYLRGLTPPVPTLGAGCIEIAKKYGMDVWMEIKTTSISSAQLTNLMNSITAYDWQDHVTVWSFNPAPLATLHAKGFNTGLYENPSDVTRKPASIKDMTDNGTLYGPGIAGTWAPGKRELDYWHSGDLQVAVWAVDDTAGWAKYTDLGADYIITNNYPGYVAWADAQ